MEEQLFYKIEAYLRQELSPTEHEAFERQIAADPELAAEVELQRLQLEAIDVLVEEDLQQHRDEKFQENMARWMVGDFQEEEIQWEKQRKQGKRKRGWWLGGAGAVLLSLLAGVYFLQLEEKPVAPNTGVEPLQNENSSEEEDQNSIFDQENLEKETSQPQQGQKRKEDIRKLQQADNSEKNRNEQLALYNQLRQSYDNSIDAKSRGSDSVNKTVLQQSYDAYATGNYQRVVELLETITPDSSNYFRSRELLGNAYLELGAYDQAIEVFNLISEQGPRSLARVAQRYLLLAYLAAGKLEEDGFQQLFNQALVNENHPAHSLAVEIKERLNL